MVITLKFSKNTKIYFYIYIYIYLFNIDRQTQITGHDLTCHMWPLKSEKNNKSFSFLTIQLLNLVISIWLNFIFNKIGNKQQQEQEQ